MKHKFQDITLWQTGKARDLTKKNDFNGFDFQIIEYKANTVLQSAAEFFILSEVKFTHDAF